MRKVWVGLCLTFGGAVLVGIFLVLIGQDGVGRMIARQLEWQSGGDAAPSVRIIEATYWWKAIYTAMTFVGYLLPATVGACLVMYGLYRLGHMLRMWPAPGDDARRADRLPRSGVEISEIEPPPGCRG